jgi:hypothetical protein
MYVRAMTPGLPKENCRMTQQPAYEFVETGRTVRAMTLKDDDRELPPREVVGKLVTRFVPTFQVTQYLVNDEFVSPESIKDVEDEEWVKMSMRCLAQRIRKDEEDG